MSPAAQSHCAGNSFDSAASEPPGRAGGRQAGLSGRWCPSGSAGGARVPGLGWPLLHLFAPSGAGGPGPFLPSSFPGCFFPCSIGRPRPPAVILTDQLCPPPAKPLLPPADPLLGTGKGKSVPVPRATERTPPQGNQVWEECLHPPHLGRREDDEPQDCPVLTARSAHQKATGFVLLLGKMTKRFQTLSGKTNKTSRTSQKIRENRARCVRVCVCVRMRVCVCV